MTLVDPKSGVAYAFGEKLPSAHVNTVWAQQPNALDLVGGGTWSSLAADVIINGTGSTRTFAYGSLVAHEFAGGTSYTGTSTVTHSSGSATTWNSGSTITNHAASTIDGTWTVSGGSWTFSGGHTLTAGAGAGTWTFNNALDVRGGASLASAITAAAGGFFSGRYAAAGASTHYSLSGGSAHTATTSAQFVNMGGASGTVTLDDDGATAGSFVVFYNAPSPSAALAYNWNGASYANSVTMHVSTTADYAWLILVFNGSTWDVGPYQINP